MIALLLAHACFLEASFAAPDCAAIVYVAAKRAGCDSPGDCPGLERSLRRYELALTVDSPRARFIRALPWGDSPAWSRADNRRWAELRALVTRLLDGTEPDPCPTARQFGSRTLRRDRERAARAIAAGRWAYAVCSRRTLNAFYRER